MTGLMEKIQEQQDGEKAVVTGNTRELAETMKSFELAKRFPRDYEQVRKRILQSCRSFPFAEKAFYKRPLGGGKFVVGPSIRLAEEMALCSGNIDFGIKFTERKPTETKYQVFAVDKELNNRIIRDGSASHFRYYKDKSPKLETRPQQIYEMVTADASKRLRAVILQIIPNGLILEAECECTKTLERGENFRPKSITQELMDLGVTKEQLEERYGDLEKPKTGIRALAIQDLQSIKAGDCTVNLIFGGKE